MNFGVFALVGVIMLVLAGASFGYLLRVTNKSSSSWMLLWFFLWVIFSSVATILTNTGFPLSKYKAQPPNKPPCVAMTPESSPVMGTEFYLRNIIAPLTGMTIEQVAAILPTNQAILLSSQVAGATFDLIGMNLIILPILFVVLWKSGDTERRIVREQLMGEPESVITPEEYAGVEAECRLQLRSFPDYSKKLIRKIRGLQNDLAFRKDYVQRQGGELDNDPPAMAIRAEIAQLRTNK